MRQQQPKIIIFSVFQYDKDQADNYKNHLKVLSALDQWEIPHKEIIGCYNRQLEKSIIIYCNSPVDVQLAVDYCKKYNQESYLLSYADRSTELIYLDGLRESIGHLKAVSSEYALTRPYYSFCPMTETYYVAE